MQADHSGKIQASESARGDEKHPAGRERELLMQLGAPFLEPLLLEPLSDLRAHKAAALQADLRGHIDRYVEEMRGFLVCWLDESIERVLLTQPVTDSQRSRQRRIRRALNLRGERAAAILTTLIDAPDTYHNYAALATGLLTPLPENAKNTIRVHVSHLRSKLEMGGIPYAIHNHNRRGYFIRSDDARRIRLLVGETAEPAPAQEGQMESLQSYRRVPVRAYK